MPSGVVRVAVVSPQEVIVRGVITMLADYPDRVAVAALPSEDTPAADVDVIVYDTIGLHVAVEGCELSHLMDETDAKVLLLSRDTRPDLRARAYVLGVGIQQWVPMSVHAADLVHSIELIAAGEPLDESQDDPSGTVDGLTAREIEILGLIAQGLSNQDIAGKLAVSTNTLKSHIRLTYHKIEVTSRSQAVTWAITHGFHPASSPGQR